MTVTRHALMESYRHLDDDELDRLSNSLDMTELARDVAATELRRRGIQPPALAVEIAREPPLEIPDETRREDSAEDAVDGGADDLVQIARFLSPMEAEILRSRLQVEDVLAIVADTNLDQTNFILAPVFGGVRVLVSRSDIERAQAIIKAVQRGDYMLDEDVDGGTPPEEGR